MRQEPPNDEKPTFSELFTQYVSDMTIAVERIKVRNMRNDIQGINEDLARINSAIMGIIDAKLELAERNSSNAKLVASQI